MAAIATDGKGNYVTLDASGNWVPTTAPDAKQVQGGDRFQDAPPEQPPPPTLGDTTAAQPGEATAPAWMSQRSLVDTSITPGPNVGNIAPLSRDPASGDIRLALPNPVRALLTEGPQVNDGKLTVPAATINPETSTLGVTPEASAAASLIGPRPLGFSGWNALMRDPVSSVTLTKPPPVTLPELNAAIVRADEQPPRNQLAPPEPAPPEPPPTAPADTPPPAAAPVTTSAQAKQVASAYYDQADRSGGTLTPAVTDKFIDSVSAVAPQTEAGQAILGQSPVSALVDRLQTLKGQPLSLQAAQEIDEGLGNLIDREYGPRGLTKDGKQLLDIQQGFRDQIRNAGPDDIVGGADGFDALGLGRQAWSQAMKLSDLERIQQRADLTDNPATSVRTQIRAILTNPARARGYSPEELAALSDAADRGVVGSALHVFGSRLIPMFAGAAGLSHGPLGGLVGAGVSHAGTTMLRNWAGSIANNRLLNAQTIIGGNVPAPPAP